MNVCDSELVQKLNRETSKIAWPELQRFYASGAVLRVAGEMDLIEVAIAIHKDNAATVEKWLEEGAIGHVDEALASRWLEKQQTVWAVVIAPWVLVQEVDND